MSKYMGIYVVKIRGKCEWYEFGEKFSKFSINLEKL